MISYASIRFSNGTLFHVVSYSTHTFVKHMWILQHTQIKIL